MRGPRTTVGIDGLPRFGLAGGRVCPVLLLVPGRCRVPTSGWLCPGSALWVDREATRSALEGARPGVETCAAGQGEASVTQVFNVALSGVGCWGVIASLGCCVLRGAVAQRGVWYVAPSLTLVLEPCGAG